MSAIEIKLLERLVNTVRAWVHGPDERYAAAKWEAEPATGQAPPGTPEAWRSYLARRVLESQGDRDTIREPLKLTEDAIRVFKRGPT